MAKLITGTIVALAMASSASGGVVGDWWQSVKDLHFNSKRYEQIQQQDQCAERLHYYQQKVQEDPNSDYFKGKLEKWQDRCE